MLRSILSVAYCVNVAVPLAPAPRAKNVTVALDEAVLGVAVTVGLKLTLPVSVVAKFPRRLASTVNVPALLGAEQEIDPSDLNAEVNALMLSDTFPAVPAVQVIVNGAESEMLVGVVSDNAGVTPASAAGATIVPLKAATPLASPAALMLIESPAIQASVDPVAVELSAAYAMVELE